MKLNIKNVSKYFVLFLITNMLFLIIKVSQISFKFSDENIYFYMGKLLLKGVVPYQDFFFASPPLQISIIAGLLTIFGSKVILLKLVPIIASLVTSSFIFIIVKKRFNSLHALLSSTLYLFSVVILTTTDHSTGVHLTTMFLVISFYYIEKEKFLLSGIISSLALTTRLYSGIAILGMGIYLIIKNRKALIKFIAGIAMVFIPLNVILIALFKTNYLNSVYLYHLLKSPGIPKINIFKFFLENDWILIFLTLTSFFTKQKRKLFPLLVISSTILLFYIFYADIYYLYLAMLIPFISIIGGTSLNSLSKKLKEKRKIFYVIGILLILIVPSTTLYLNNHAKTSKIEFLEEITNFIESNTSENQTIYGNFEITPLIALKTGRKITKNYIDTNEKTFLSGLYKIEEREKEIRNKTKFIITKNTILKDGEITDFDFSIPVNYLQKNCNITKIYPIKKDYSNNAVVLWKCL